MAEIDRQGVILPAVGPQERLQAGDRLLFVGVIESVVDLQKMRGLTPATDQTFKPDAPRTQRCLIGSQLTRAERLFLAWFAPRGIVTASVASVFALRLGESSVVMVPATFLVIIVTVAVYAKEIARLTQ